MDIFEHALQLTLKAMETGAIPLEKNGASIEHPQSAEKVKEFNMQAVGDFYQAMVKAVECAYSPED